MTLWMSCVCARLVQPRNSPQGEHSSLCSPEDAAMLLEAVSASCDTQGFTALTESTQLDEPLRQGFWFGAACRGGSLWGQPAQLPEI